jgi:uncharacterized protein (DUF2164 family)
MEPSMAIELSGDDRKQALASLKRFCEAELEVEIGNLQTMALLDYFLKEIGPSVYNKAVSDAQVYLRDRVADLEGACYEPEFTYWPKGTSVRRK